MPILMMALLALLVFGLIGILLSAAVLLESSNHSRSVKSGAAPPVDHGAASLHSKL